MTEAGRDLAERAARVVLAMDAAAREGTALDILRCLTGEHLQDLLGLIVEDARVLAHARSRLAREIVTSGSERPLEAAALARQLRAQAEAARRRFESAAARLGLRYRSEVASGDLLEELGRRAEEAETLVVSEALESVGLRPDWRPLLHALATRRLRSMLFARPGWTTGGSVLAIVHDWAREERLVETARSLAEHSRSPLRLLLAAKTESGQRDLLHAIEQARGKWQPLPPGSVYATAPEAVAAAARHERPRLIVVPWEVQDDGSESVVELLAKTQSAILLVK